jgi:hypothetical protein
VHLSFCSFLRSEQPPFWKHIFSFFRLWLYGSNGVTFSYESDVHIMRPHSQLSKKYSSKCVQSFGLLATHKNHHANHKMIFSKMAAHFTSLRTNCSIKLYLFFLHKNNQPYKFSRLLVRRPRRKTRNNIFQDDSCQKLKKIKWGGQWDHRTYSQKNMNQNRSSPLIWRHRTGICARTNKQTNNNKNRKVQKMSAVIKSE